MPSLELLVLRSIRVAVGVRHNHVQLLVLVSLDLLLILSEPLLPPLLLGCDCLSPDIGNLLLVLCLESLDLLDHLCFESSQVLGLLVGLILAVVVFSLGDHETVVLVSHLDGAVLVDVLRDVCLLGL